VGEGTKTGALIKELLRDPCLPCLAVINGGCVWGRPRYDFHEPGMLLPLLLQGSSDCVRSTSIKNKP